MFEYFYNEIMRKTIIGFGTLFNSIVIKQATEQGEIFSEIKVPLAYGPKQKFLARLEESPDLNKPFQMTLPRMSFEFTNLSYDSSRKVSTIQTFLAGKIGEKSKVLKTYMPVPYNMDFELSIMTKLNDDMLQIVEQIVPYFQPSYNLSINLIDLIGEKRDVPIILNNIRIEDNYEGNFDTRRYLIYTITFTVKTYLYGPTSSVDKDIIKQVVVNYVSGNSDSIEKNSTFSVEPLSSVSYTNNVVTILSLDIEEETKSILVDNSQNIPINSFITINKETLKVISKDSNILDVERGLYSTLISPHVSGSEIKLISNQDNNLIEFGDNFGFNGTIT